MSPSTDRIALAEWRRKISSLYCQVRRSSEIDVESAWYEWRKGRDYLIKHHQQSPLSKAQRTSFQALDYFDYDPEWRILGSVQSVTRPKSYSIDLGQDGVLTYSTVARAIFFKFGRELTLDLFWLDGYGGGLFVPFRDVSSGRETFGRGRYLFDTVKGADLGMSGNDIVLDFNFAYNPSCAYHSRWVCPLAPAENLLQVSVLAGEKAFAAPAD